MEDWFTPFSMVSKVHGQPSENKEMEKLCKETQGLRRAVQIRGKGSQMATKKGKGHEG